MADGGGSDASGQQKPSGLGSTPARALASDPWSKDHTVGTAGLWMYGEARPGGLSRWLLYATASEEPLQFSNM